MSDFATARQNMVDCQVRPSDVTDNRIVDAMLAIPREIFVPDDRRALLAWLEAEARLIGYRALRLETRLANTRALRFYTAHGYRRIDNFGRYAGHPAAACFEKIL